MEKQVPSATKREPVMPEVGSSQSSESRLSKADVQTKVATPAPPPKIDTSVLPPKSDYVAVLLNMLTVEMPTTNDLESSSKYDHSWAQFQCKCAIFNRLTGNFVLFKHANQAKSLVLIHISSPIHERFFLITSIYSTFSLCFPHGDNVHIMNAVAAEMTTAALQKASTKPVETKPASGIEDLIKDSPNSTLSSSPAKPQTNVRVLL